MLRAAATELSQIVRHNSEMIRTFRPRLWLPILVLLASVAVSAQENSSAAEITSPDLALIVQRLEDVQHQNTAQSQPYKVVREYKVFHGDEKRPSSEVMAQISFVPPDTRTYRITQAGGKSRGEKMVRELLDQGIESAKRSHESEIVARTTTSFFSDRKNSAFLTSMSYGSSRKGRRATFLAGRFG